MTIYLWSPVLSGFSLHSVFWEIIRRIAWGFSLWRPFLKEHPFFIVALI